LRMAEVIRYDRTMKPRVYLETTIPSYLTAWPSRDLLQAANQQVTRQWWEQRDQFDLFISQLVIDECQAGDPQAAADRLAVLADITVLDETLAATHLAKALSREVPLPTRAANDALHVAIATVQGLDYFLTWNCRHIANLVFRPRIEAVCQTFGYLAPAIGTPQELLKQEPFHD